ncbi:SDR family NAD(P)-dependent oxidoreductase [Azohydromonas sediminis]|uniref:SDR family NAD(P)-dependent oxidoreductase n=1 Tax=Azohydromonas sediminis TaxID=2259674 RepID=UPI000E653D6C|nr:SDR family NAD(P)-dependent oxidoreductase [Azohydromonas sediminis]
MPLNPPITDWTRQVVWLVGASSGIGRATAAHLDALGARVVVSARNAAALDAFAAQHAGSLAIALDATDRDAMRTVAARIVEQHGRIDLAMYCAGHYKPMRATAFDLDDALRHQQVNYVGALHLLDAVLPQLIRQAGAGQPAHLSLVSSVAGYRGLPKSLAYGPTKAALINLAETLYLDLHPLGVGVSVINPGFVDTPLTAQNEFRMPALIGSDEAARQIVAGWQKGRFEIHFPKRFTHALKALSVLSDGLYFAAIRRATGL